MRLRSKKAREPLKADVCSKQSTRTGWHMLQNLIKKKTKRKKDKYIFRVAQQNFKSGDGLKWLTAVFGAKQTQNYRH